MWKKEIPRILAVLMIAGICWWVWTTPRTPASAAMDLGPTTVASITLTVSPSTVAGESTSNVTLSVSPLLAPIVTNGVGATNVGSTTARLNGEVTETGNEDPSVTVYYGTSDGGTNPASWSDNASLGTKALGTYYHDVSSLSQSTLYYYRMYAENAAGSDWADSSANFTTTLQLDPPAGFTLTDLGAITVTANWTTGAGATYTMVRASRTAYPTTPTEGEFIYYGDGISVNSTGYDLDIILYYFSAFSYLSDNTTYATTYATASIGGDGMTEVATSLDGLASVFGTFATTASLAAGALLVIGLFAIALWRREVVYYTVSGVVSLFIGFEWLTDYTGISLVIMGLGCFQLLEALLLSLSAGGPSKGISQFKGIIDSVKGWF